MLHASDHHHLGYGLQYAQAVNPARRPDGPAFAGEFVDQRH